ncbi:MAG: hypothetical protein JXB15_03960 [Anaerolineales bacterium]|nr:hypothetical protein [Anaerolineales bacterium]
MKSTMGWSLVALILMILLFALPVALLVSIDWMGLRSGLLSFWGLTISVSMLFAWLTPVLVVVWLAADSG